MRFKKLRKIYRILFPAKYTELDLFEQKLSQNNLIKAYSKEKNVYNVELFDGKRLFLRDYNYSDYEVFEQIFNFKEYEIFVNLFNLNNEFSNKKIIIDAGANVGYTTLFFADKFSDFSIFSIEPSQDNFELCVKNTSYKNIKLYNRALSEKANMRYTIERDFRDKKDWSITTKEDDLGVVLGISVKEIIDENKLDYISLLKIDIEGAERFIFKEENDLSYLSITQIIAIEIHDEFNVRKSIENLLIKNNFFLFESGELTIGINKKFLR